jgi:hypothetical protein
MIDPLSILLLLIIIGALILDTQIKRKKGRDSVAYHSFVVATRIVLLLLIAAVLFIMFGNYKFPE